MYIVASHLKLQLQLNNSACFGSSNVSCMGSLYIHVLISIFIFNLGCISMKVIRMKAKNLWHLSLPWGKFEWILDTKNVKWLKSVGSPDCVFQRTENKTMVYMMKHAFKNSIQFTKRENRCINYTWFWRSFNANGCLHPSKMRAYFSIIRRSYGFF